MLTIAPPPAFGHLARHRLADQEGALEVDVDHRVPVGLGDVEEVGGAEDAGVVDQDVDPSERRERRRGRGLDLAAAGDVAADRPGLGAELGGERLGRGGVDVPEREPGAARREQPRAGGADAVGGAGDDDDLAGEIECVSWPCSGSGAVEPDADALGIELEVEGEQLADALVGQRDAVRAQALQVDRLAARASAPRAGPAPWRASGPAATISSSWARNRAARRGTSSTGP